MAGRGARHAALAALLAAFLGGAVLAGMMLATHGVRALLTGPEGPEPGSRPAPSARQVPPGRPARIAILGTSLTARGGWPDELAARLSMCRPDGVRVRRTARPGASSRWGVKAIERALSPRGAPPPDILIIEFATNDAALHRGVRLRQSIALHREMLAQARGMPVFLAVMNPVHGVSGWVRPGLAAYNAAYRRLAVESRAGLIDTAPAWAVLDRAVRQRLVPDGLHPNAEGMRRVALPAFVAALAPLVCTAPLPRADADERGLLPARGGSGELATGPAGAHEPGSH